MEGAAGDKGPLCEGLRDSAASEEMTCHRDLPGMSPAPSTWPGSPRSGRGWRLLQLLFPCLKGPARRRAAAFWDASVWLGARGERRGGEGESGEGGRGCLCHFFPKPGAGASSEGRRPSVGFAPAPSVGVGPTAGVPRGVPAAPQSLRGAAVNLASPARPALRESSPTLTVGSTSFPHHLEAVISPLLMSKRERRTPPYAPLPALPRLQNLTLRAGERPSVKNARP